MAELTTIARPYAKALFQHAQAAGETQLWSQMIKVIAEISVESSMGQYLRQPQLTAAQQVDAFRTVCGDEINEQAANFLMQLSSNKRLDVLPEIYALYNLYVAELEQSEEVSVVSAFALSAGEEQKLIDMLKKKLGKSVSLQTSVDNSLIGGVVVRAGDLVIDSSVRGKIAKLAETLNS